MSADTTALPATDRRDRLWNPYLAGVALGLVLLASFLIFGRGLGASGAANRLGIAAMEVVAPARAAAVPSIATTLSHGPVLHDWLVFEVLGVFLGGLLGAYSGGRLKWEILRGPRISPAARLSLAVAGGVLMGIAARIARGCTSGQALSGGAVLSVHSWIFMMAVFAGGYAAAWFVRREWT